MMNPHDTEMDDIFNVLFYTVSRLSDMRYSKSREMAHAYRDEEWEISGVLRRRRGVHLDAGVENLEHQWGGRGCCVMIWHCRGHACIYAFV